MGCHKQENDQLRWEPNMNRFIAKLLLLAAAGVMTIQLDSLADETNPVIKTITPVEIDIPLNNPDMGNGLWAGPRYFDGRPFSMEYNTTGFGDSAPLFDWVLFDWMWADLEPQEGKYDWKDLDFLMNYWASRGKQIYLRVWVTDDPGWNGAPGNEVCPAWLWAAGARYREYVGEGKSRKREPDYLDSSFEAIYLPRVRRFLSALAERYDKPESPVVMWGVMGYGQWGEWHTMWSHYPWPNRDSKHAVLSRIVQMYSEIFKAKVPCISYCFDSDLKEVTSLEDYMYRQALDLAVSKGFALARHGFIDGLGIWDKQVMESYWQKSPMLAEGDWSYSDVKDHGTHGTLEENFEVMLNYHSNFAHFYMDADSYKRAMREDRSSFEKVLRSGGLGYRLVLTSASWTEELPAGSLLLLRQHWANRNMGRCYRRFPLRLFLTDTAGNVKFQQSCAIFDPTRWVKGTDYPVTGIFALPKDLVPGIYSVRIGLIDESGKPRIRLGIEGIDSQLRYKLGTIKIIPAHQP